MRVLTFSVVAGAAGERTAERFTMLGQKEFVARRVKRVEDVTLMPVNAVIRMTQ